VRILYLADIRFPLERANGIQTMETCHALASRGHTVTLVVRPDTQSPARDPFAYYALPTMGRLHIERVVVKGPAVLRRSTYVVRALGRGARRGRQDLIFTRDLALASLVLRLPRAFRAPLVYESHGMADETAAALPTLLTGAPEASAAKRRRLARREARVWKRADGYVTITQGLADALTGRFGTRTALAVAPDGTRSATDNANITDCANITDNTATHRTDPAGRFTVAYSGHLYPWKGVDLVIEAVAALPDARGLIIGGHPGEPDLARLSALAGRLHCAERITFTGLLLPRDARRRLQAADVVVLPNPASTISTRFTSPLKLFEYMASGRPIVASDLPSIREVLRDGESAILVNAGDAQALTDGLRRLRDDQALGARLARRALEEVSRYTWDERARRLGVLFTQVVG
jgi:glycosyltransferase involved in cell wall biosynthesis